MVFAMSNLGISFAIASMLSLDLEIITPAWMKTSQFGGIPFIGPAFKTAFAEIAQAHPRLRVTQELVYNCTFQQCSEWATDSDRQLAEFYYGSRPRHADRRLTVFVLAGMNYRESL